MYRGSLSYDDVALVPQYYAGNSRSQISTQVELGDFTFALPVVPANMKCVIDVATAKLLQSNNYFYIMHRFDVDTIAFVQQCKDENWQYASISLGCKQEDWHVVTALAQANLMPEYITIDIAHGHSLMMQNTIAHIKKHLPKTFVIAGNVATPQAYEDLCNWGADAVKVGVGPGKACTTRLKTGFYSPMFSTISAIAMHREQTTSHQPIIADGGVQRNGDIAKAIVAGANMVMAGSIFAACTDSPAPSVGKSGKKTYFGSASAANKGHKRNVEGRTVLIEDNYMTYLEKLQEITQDLQSAISYAGGTLDTNTDWMVLHQS